MDTVAKQGPMIDHKDLLSSAEAIEGLPITVTKLARLIADPRHEVRDIVDVVSLDQALTATLLRRANSTALGGTHQIKTVRDAAVRLGPNALLSMALAASVSRTMNSALPAYGLAEGQLWKQSVAASVAADVVRTKATVEVPPEAATAALLHDFGKIVLSRHFGTQILEMLARAAQTDGITLVEAEQSVFGVNHADIGGLVAAQWKLPHTIVDAIIHHHDTGVLSPVCAAVSLGHAMVPEVLDGAAALAGRVPQTTLPDAPPAGAADSRSTSPVAESHAEVFATLGIPVDRYAPLLATATQRYVDLAGHFDVV